MASFHLHRYSLENLIQGYMLGMFYVEKVTQKNEQTDKLGVNSEKPKYYKYIDTTLNTTFKMSS